jgi:hypothetical protein
VELSAQTPDDGSSRARDEGGASVEKALASAIMKAAEAWCAIGCQASPAAISKGAEPQYTADVARLMNDTDALSCSRLIGAPVNLACCVGGACRWGIQCHARDAAAETGADGETDSGGSDAATDASAKDAGAE